MSIVPQNRLSPTTRYRNDVCPPAGRATAIGTGTTSTFELLNGAVFTFELKMFVNAIAAAPTATTKTSSG